MVKYLAVFGAALGWFGGWSWGMVVAMNWGLAIAVILIGAANTLVRVVTWPARKVWGWICEAIQDFREE